MIDLIIDEWIISVLKGIAVCLMAVLIVVVIMLSMADESMTPKYTVLSQDGDVAVYMVQEGE